MTDDPILFWDDTPDDPRIVARTIELITEERVIVPPDGPSMVLVPGDNLVVTIYREDPEAWLP
jgi:hypothetical protein